MTLWRFFVRKENIELRDEKTQERTLKEAVYGRKTPKIQGLAVTPSGEGRGNGKKPIWVWGALLEKGREG